MSKEELKIGDYVLIEDAGYSDLIVGQMGIIKSIDKLLRVVMLTGAYSKKGHVFYGNSWSFDMVYDKHINKIKKLTGKELEKRQPIIDKYYLMKYRDNRD